MEIIEDAPPRGLAGIFIVAYRNEPFSSSGVAATDGITYMHEVVAVRVQSGTVRGGERLESRPHVGRVGQGVDDRVARVTRSVVSPHRYR